MLWGTIMEGGLPMTSPVHKKVIREDSIGSLDVSSLSSESNESFPATTRRSSQVSDIFHYLDEETQDGLYYQEVEEDESTFESVTLLAQKLEKEVNALFQNNSKVGSNPPTILVNLSETTNRVAHHLLELSDNEPYGVKGARIFVKFTSLNGEERIIGSFTLDPNTVSTFEITLSLEQGQQFSTSLRSWFGQITNGTKSIQISPHYSLRKKDLYTCNNQESVIFSSAA